MRAICYAGATAAYGACLLLSRSREDRQTACTYGCQQDFWRGLLTADAELTKQNALDGAKGTWADYRPSSCSADKPNCLPNGSIRSGVPRVGAVDPV
jgi:hypothetical protein